MALISPLRSLLTETELTSLFFKFMVPGTARLSEPAAVDQNEHVSSSFFLLSSFFFFFFFFLFR